VRVPDKVAPYRLKMVSQRQKLQKKGKEVCLLVNIVGVSALQVLQDFAVTATVFVLPTS
jgi:hypothetical protein